MFLFPEMDGIQGRHDPLLVLGATNRPEALDAALRRPGRFDTEIEVGVPSEAQRRGVLADLVARTSSSLDAAQLDELAACTAGFVGADLAALHRHAALNALRRGEALPSTSDKLCNGPEGAETTPAVPDSPSHERLDGEMAPVGDDHQGSQLLSQAREASITNASALQDSEFRIHLEWDDFHQALRIIRPSALREVREET